MRTLQEWMQYMEDRKRSVREAEAPSEESAHQADQTKAAPRRRAAAETEAAAPASPRARRVVSAPTSGTRSSAALISGLPGSAGTHGGSLARGVEQAREQMRRALQARQAGQRELPLDVPPTEPARGSRRSADESRDELIGRLLDPELTLQETAKLLNVCPTTVRRYTNRGVLSHYRTPGNQRRFRLSDVLEFMRRQQAARGQST